LKWTSQIAEGLAYIHRKGIVQGDAGCHNILLKHDEVKLCDFGGSSIHGEPAKAGYECRSQRWDSTFENPSIPNELFALGSTIYEIWTTTRPYQNEPDDMVEQNYKCLRFPDLGSLPVAETIHKCWHGTYTSADEVIMDLKSLEIELKETHKYTNVNYAAILAAFVSVMLAAILAAWLPPRFTVTTFLHS